MAGSSIQLSIRRKCPFFQEADRISRHGSCQFLQRSIMAEQLNIIIVPHTHWDREWYQTFQQFRMRLVRTVDKLLDILDHDDKFSYFMLDGQTIVLDDYLEVRPEQEEHLKRYTRAGRVLVGPWYLQPDEFLVSGESLVRNLQIGLQRAAEFGEPMRVGYVPDCFGHIAQLPQILRGFDIDSAVFWRGVGAEVHKSEFYWSAPDGTSVLVVHLADTIGYSNARIMPLVPEEFATRVELLSANLLGKGTTDTLLFMNGSDHLEPQDGLPAAIEAANVLLAHIDPRHRKLLASFIRQNGDIPQYNSIHVRMGTLPQYVAVVRQHVESQQRVASPLETLSGEMRSSQYAHLLPGVLSTRMWIKQQNTLTEHLLERWVEPMTAWAWRLGAPYPRGLVRLAWKYLLQNHPHDSICGCSIDQVHRENSVRFAQSQQVGEGMVAQAMQHLVAAMDTCAPFPVSHASHEPIPIVVFNPAPGPRTEAVRVVVSLPASLRNAALVDERGEHMVAQAVQRWKQELGSMPVAREVLAATVALSGVTTPGQFIHMAHETIKAMLNQPEDTRMITHIHITEHADMPGVAHIEIVVVPRGQAAINEQELLAAEQQVLALLEREDLATLEFSLVEQVRETIDFAATDLPAYGLKTFWLYPRGIKGEKHPEPVSTLAGRQVDETNPRSFIENEFFRVEASAEDGTLMVTDKPTAAVFTGLKRFVDVSDGTIGLGVLNRGLSEYEVVQDGPGLAPGQVAVALTLLRCIEWLSRGDLSTRRGHAGPMEYTPEAQCQGHQEFDYALVPHSGEWEAEHALVLREAQAFNTPVRAVVAEQHPGQQPARAALVEVEPQELVVSAIKCSNAGEGLIVRVYNPLDHAVEASLRPGVAATRAFVTNLHEEQREQLFWSGEGNEGHESEPVHVGMRAGEILTILFQ